MPLDFDPFVEEEPVVKEEKPLEDEVLHQWMILKKDDLEAYDEELSVYLQSGDDYPEYMFKSADKYILSLLETYKSYQIPSPSRVLHQQLSVIVKGLAEKKKKLVFMDLLFMRLEEDVMLIANLQNEKEKPKAWAKLKERGFIG